MNKRLKTGIYIIGLSLISSGSVVSTQVVAKENNSDISLVEVKKHYSDQEIIDFMIKSGFKFISDADDSLVFKLRGEKNAVIITSDDMGFEFLSWVISEKGFSLEKLNKFSLESQRMPNLFVDENKKVIFIKYNLPSREGFSSNQIVDAALYVTAMGAKINKAKDRLEN
jgi:hypothetical protein